MFAVGTETRLKTGLGRCDARSYDPHITRYAAEGGSKDKTLFWNLQSPTLFGYLNNAYIGSTQTS
jgi:hypothetical protein